MEKAAYNCDIKILWIMLPWTKVRMLVSVLLIHSFGHKPSRACPQEYMHWNDFTFRMVKIVILKEKPLLLLQISHTNGPWMILSLIWYEYQKVVLTNHDSMCQNNGVMFSSLVDEISTSSTASWLQKRASWF